MMSTWNKFCFTGGYVAASVQLPGVNDIVGLWPSIWLVNLFLTFAFAKFHLGLWEISEEQATEPVWMAW